MTEEEMTNVRDGVGILICNICQTPITGSVSMYKGEPVHFECSPKNYD